MSPDQIKKLSSLERFSVHATRWVGSTQSLLVHTILFGLAFTLAMLGIDIERILLVLTTIVSLEAIYLSIFIQMSVNRQTRRLHAVSKDIDEIQKDVEEIQEDVEGIEKDVEEIQEGVEGIEKDVDEIQKDVDEIQENVEELNEEDDVTEQSLLDAEEHRFVEIQKALITLSEEVSKLQKTKPRTTTKSSKK